MTAFKKQIQRHSILYWGVLILCGVLTQVYASAGGAWAASGSGRVIVIDPGHGGHDQGGGVRAGEYEKDITLKLALAVAEALRPDYRVVLTRTGDYHMDLTRRAAVANLQRADLFISLHLGGSPQQHVNVWEIYTFGDPDIAPEHQGVAQGPDQTTGPENSEGILWRDIQARHETAGRNLADHLKSRLQGDSRIPEVTLRQAPLRVLQGIDAPAVVLEAGYLSNPTAREALSNPRFVSDLANHIREAVDAYFQTGN